MGEAAGEPQARRPGAGDPTGPGAGEPQARRPGAGDPTGPGAGKPQAPPGPGADGPTGPARAIVLCGLPGSGKTTRARQLAAERRALRLCPDEWMRALGIDLWDEAARARVEELQWDMAQELLPLGTSVVIEWGTWARAERDRLRETCRRLGAGVELHYLDVPLETLAGRLVRRNALPGEVVIDPRYLDEWAQQFEPPTAEELALFDHPPP